MVEWSGPAKRDLKQIYDYIAHDSKYYAKKVVRNIVDKTETLEPFPNAGRMVPEINAPNVREKRKIEFRSSPRTGGYWAL